MKPLIEHQLEGCFLTNERLWDALMWLDTHNPEDTAAMEKRFHFDLMKREVYEAIDRR